MWLHLAGSLAGLGIVLLSSGDSYKLFALLQTVAMVGAVLADRSLTSKLGLPVYCRVMNWAVLVACPVLLIWRVLGGQNSLEWRGRAGTVFAALLPVLTVLSVSYEVAFFSVFHLYLISGCSTSTGTGSVTPTKARWLNHSDLLLVADFIAALNMSFFGTGNIASLASFSLPSVYRLLTAFRPFAMASLLILKQLVPLLYLSPVVILVAREMGLQPFSVFLVAAAVTDVVTVHMFFRVSGVGSWLEIGMGISRFVIAGLFLLIGLLMYGVGMVLAQ
jgi:phosphatidylinositol glycan class N